jgi:hypothetical protein
VFGVIVFSYASLVIAAADDGLTPQTQEVKYSRDFVIKSAARRIRNQWSPPKDCFGARDGIVTARIGKDGKLLSLGMDRSTRNPALDTSELSAVRSAAPYAGLVTAGESSEVSIKFLRRPPYVLVQPIENTKVTGR